MYNETGKHEELLSTNTLFSLCPSSIRQGSRALLLHWL